MFKIMDSTAIFRNGMVKLSDGTLLFHIIHSKQLSILLGHSSSSVPIPLLFKQFPNPFTNSIPLFCGQTPKLSMVRLLLSTHPYALNSRLEVGYKQPNGIVVLNKIPVIKYIDFEDECIKAQTTLMVCTKEDMSDAFPLTDDLNGRMALSTVKKQVIIDESKNQCFEFFINQKVSTKKLHTPTQIPIPIIKNLPKTDVMQSNKYAQMFYTIATHSLQIGDCPAASFNTILIMSRSQNSLNILPKDSSINSKQKLFLKHVILHQMGLENAISDFESLYEKFIKPISREQTEEFFHMVYDLKCKLEDTVFALNSICKNRFSQTFSQGSCKMETLLLMEKYFLMFTPLDKINAINFSAGIVELIFNGVDFKKLLSFLEQYMEIQTSTPEDNMFKMYALLTN